MNILSSKQIQIIALCCTPSLHSSGCNAVPIACWELGPISLKGDWEWDICIVAPLYSNLSHSHFCFAGLRNSNYPLISPQRRIMGMCHWMAVSQARAVKKGCRSTSLTATYCALRIWAGAAHKPETGYCHPARRYILLLSLGSDPNSHEVISVT